MGKPKKPKRVDKRIRKHLVVTIPPALKEQLFARAAAQGVTATSLAEDALEAFLAQPAEAP